MYLKRKAYEELTAWKKRPDHSTLEVSGARQVGKTYIVNRFADEQYSQKIYINLLDLSGELFFGAVPGIVAGNEIREKIPESNI